MSSGVMVVGSPLDEYLREQGESLDDHPNTRVDNPIDGQDDTDESGDMTFVESSDTSRDSSTSPPKEGWTGVIPSIPGPSNSTPPSAFPINAEFEADEAFAERFKYLVCSSGLLEKEWVSGLSGNPSSPDTPGGIDQEVPFDLPPGRDRLENVSSTRWTRGTRWLRYARERWDIALAGIVLAIALVVILGLKALLIDIAILAGLVAVMSGMYLRFTCPTSDLSSSKYLSSSVASPEEGPDSAALHSLTSLLADSRRLDRAIDTSLSHFPPDSSLTSHQSLRLALHRITGDITDHLASATSRLLELVDGDELVVLGEMYDIPVPGLSRRHRGADSDDEGLDVSAKILSPRRPARPLLEHRSSSSTSAGRAESNHIAASIPMSSSQSLPGDIRPPHRSHQLSLITNTLPTPRQPMTSIEDRFTVIPPGPPRSSKRSSWDSEVWTKARSQGTRRPPNERRITEAAEEGEGDISSSDVSNISSDAGVTKQVRVSPSLRPPMTYIPARTSPLSRRLPMMLDRHPALWESSTATTDLDNSFLPSSFSSLARSSSNSDNPKRRSLQNMPYYRSSEEDPITPPRLPRSIDLGAGLSRTQSLPFSDLQALRSRSATGSRRSSVNSPQQALSPTPPARLSRVPSVNPLSVLGLKAACLGVHLKRRRMACCLLALRFQAGVSSDYWQEVKAALNELKEAMVVQRDTLEAARKEAERESSSAMTLDGLTSSGLIPPWPITFGRPVDFAPRTSEQAIMLGHIEKLRSALTKAWADLSTVQASLLDGPDGLAIQWKVLREDLGVMIREWERGKDVVARLTPDDDINHDVPVMNGGVDNGTVPEFLKAWDDEDGVAPSALNGIPGEIQPRLDPPMLEPAIPMSSSEVVEAYSEELPPPGIDEVFEAISVPLRSDKSALSGLSRDERIRLTKEARTKGISLGDLLEGGKDDKGPSQVEKAVRMNGNEVVSELRGMIGMIRKRKGQVEGTSEADLCKENEGEDKTGIPKEERESSKSERVEVEGVKTYLGLEISAQKRSQKI